MRILREVKLAMRDDVRLAANVFLPDEPGRYPAILLRTPYLKERTAKEWLYADQEGLTRHGYAVVVQDCRGTGQSEGVLDSSGANEVNDGYDSVEAVAAQEWCNGHVGMFGLSYFGFDQIAAAENDPPHLDTLCPFQNSALEPLSITRANTFGYYHLRWLYGRVRDSLPNMRLSQKEQTRILEQISYYETHWDEMVRFLPTREMPAARIEGLPVLYDFVMLVDGVEDQAYWKHAHRPIQLRQIDHPMFFLTGWFDGAKDGTFDNYEEVMTHGTETARKNSRLVVGPWIHGGELSAELDGENFGLENSGEGQQIREQMRKWFDHWMKETEDTPDWPRVSVFELGANRWLSEEEWPPQRAARSCWYLHGMGNQAAGMLVPELLYDTAPDTYTYDPDDPVPSELCDEQGRTLMADPSYLDNREDVLVYLSGELKETIEVAGKVCLSLYAATDATDTDFFARLCDVDENGRAFALLNGVVRARFRNGKTPELLTPNEIVEYTIELGNLCAMIRTGHRLKLTITSSCFPAHDRNLNSGERTGWGTKVQVAHQTILHDAEHPSHLVLPVLQ